MGNDEFDEILSALDRETARIRVRCEPRRYNKPATVISGFPPGVDLPEITRSLKNRLATGGSVVEGEVYLQGDHRSRIREELGKLGFDSGAIEVSNTQLPKRGRRG
ncbi:MAG: hypothetical protein L3J96_01485 [Thermoplasmata archaeon]|nr:hypothetical protein [Thermoplasmata archaeon]